MRNDPIYNKGYDDGFADGSNQFEDKLLVEAIATYMVANGCASTISCNRIFGFEDLAEHFHITKEGLSELTDDIVDKLAEFPQVMDSDGILVEEDSFNLMFFGNYCNVDTEEV